MANCPYCGTPLRVVNDGWFCPNHGFCIVEEEKEESSDDDKEKPSYFG